jgi:hypothetical protein
MPGTRPGMTKRMDFAPKKDVDARPKAAHDAPSTIHVFAGSETRKNYQLRHGRACPGHPRLA